MIRSDSEFRDALRRVKAEQESLADHEAKLRAMGLSEEQILAGMAPLRTFHIQFAEEVEQYARVRNKDLGCFDSLHDLGRILIGARIASNLSGRALAKKLGVNESQVSRDERNEYSGITIERACEILEALDVEMKVECKLRQVRNDPRTDFMARDLLELRSERAKPKGGSRDDQDQTQAPAETEVQAVGDHLGGP